ncbi:MAG: hypothetical protein JXD22_08130 [Sedimentisphaerales bacterium]|nr:hypothetical protein [Sedimentisphaerales bacterium]
MRNCYDGTFKIREISKKMLVGLGIIALLLTAGCGGSGGSAGGGGYGNGSKDYSGANIGLSGEPARFTISLATYTQIDKLEMAKWAQGRARQVLGNDVWLEYERDGISVNYGRFDKNTPGSKAQREFERVKRQYKQLELGKYQFCYIKELPEPDPPAPTEWNILESGCYYSLEIGVFYNVPDEQYMTCKKDAVQAVKNLRDEGEKAYFFHDRAKSFIYVGCLPESVIQYSQQGQETKTLVSPMVQMLMKKYQYHENGQKIYDIHYDKNNNRLRIARPPVMIQVDKLAGAVGY